MSFRERRRLFDKPGSAWSDYDPKLLSRGGAVFERKAKSLTVSDEVKALFELPSNTVKPNDLMRALLLAKVDLLWFGGIGTYVKSSEESNAQARRSEQRRASHRRRPDPRAGRRRGSQPRMHPARAHRIRARGRKAQHRRDRQLGGRRHLRSRGEHQDPARLHRPEGKDEAGGAGPDPRRDDR